MYINFAISTHTLKMDALNIILDRHRATGANYVDVFSCDDKGKKTPKSNLLDLENKSNYSIGGELQIQNTGGYGVFVNINPLKENSRKKNSIIKILNVFIDLDHANEDHNNLIKTKLKDMGLTYYYNAKSGHGYHFLIPVDLPKEDEQKVKGFLYYLKENICNKVDTATWDNPRLMRAPESEHNKDEVSKKLETLHTHEPTQKEIESNSKIIEEYQVVNKKSEKDLQYLSQVVRKDSFFSTILNETHNWETYIEYLNQSGDRNGHFIKNLAIFRGRNPEYKNSINAFIEKWGQPQRLKAMDGWVKNVSEINYFELLKWAKSNKLDIWVKLLEEQTKSTFLDNYEFYILEAEKKDNGWVLYYPEQNYYVQKSLQDILTIVYYNCREKGIDLFEELNLTSLDKWHEKGYRKQLEIMFSALYKKIDKENRSKLVYNINYEPCEDKFIWYKNKKYFNTYKKTSWWDEFVEETQYTFPLIKELLMNLCGQNDKNYEYLNNWLSFIINNPTTKIPTAIIFQGQQGSGKGRFKSLILDNIFGENCQEINQSSLESNFNDYLLGKQIIVANEVMHNENRQVLPNILKNLVTDEDITINQKYMKPIVGKNFTHWIFCTNSDNPIKIDPDDRRYSVFYSHKLKGGGKAAAKFIQELEKNLDHELKQYISYLKSLDVKYEDVHEPILTEAKQEIIEMNKDSVQRFIESLKQYKDFFEAEVNIFGGDKLTKLQEEKNGPWSHIPAEEFYKLYLHWTRETGEFGAFSKQNFGKKISNFGCQNKLKKIEGKVYRAYELNMIENILFSKDIRGVEE